MQHLSKTLAASTHVTTSGQLAGVCLLVLCVQTVGVMTQTQLLHRMDKGQHCVV